MHDPYLFVIREPQDSEEDLVIKGHGVCWSDDSVTIHYLDGRIEHIAE